jgi:CheY-like chemotaxis protein
MTKHRKLILIADDSEDDRNIFQLAIHHRCGLEIGGVTGSGTETIDYLNTVSSQWYPDLLVLDYQMPGCNGLEVLEWLSSQTRRPNVLLWSDFVDQIDAPAAYRFGANLVCAKPCNPAEILARISRALSEPPWAPVRAQAQPRALLQA